MSTPTRDPMEDVPFRRLLAVELRKLVNTRAGTWLVIGLLAICTAMTIAIVTSGRPQHLSFGNIWGMLNLPMSFLLPVLAILLVTSEWSQRTALITFALEPRRRRVLAAKLATTVVMTVTVLAVTALFAAIGTVLCLALRDGAAGWQVSDGLVRNLVLLQFAHILEGFGFGLLLRATAPAIVTYFVLPAAWTIVGSVLPWLPDGVRDWIDFTAAQAPFQNGEAPFYSAHSLGAIDWLQLAVAAALWCAVPALLGSRRVLRADVG